MKPFKKLAIFCIMFGIVIESIMAQLPINTGYLFSTGMTSFQVGNLGLANCWFNISQLSQPTGWEPACANIGRMTGLTFDLTNTKYNDLISTHALFNSAIVKLPAELTIMEDFVTTGLFDIKNGIPFIDPAISYYCPYEKTDYPTLCGCPLYRVAAFVIPRMLQFKYPGAHNTIIYPPSYLQPRYFLREISE
jgi:hypothetical protein